MRTWHIAFAFAVLIITLLAGAVPSQAQQVTVGTRFHTAQDQFFENNTISWSGNYRGISFSFNGAAALSKPQFGSPDPTAGLGRASALSARTASSISPPTSARVTRGR